MFVKKNCAQTAIISEKFNLERDRLQCNFNGIYFCGKSAKRKYESVMTELSRQQIDRTKICTDHVIRAALNNSIFEII